MDDMLPKSTFRENESYFVSKKIIFLKLLILFISGLIFSFAFPSYNFSVLGWIGLIPLYLAIKDVKPNRAFFFGLVWGYGWAIASFFWLRKIEPFIPFGMALVLALFPALWAALVSLTRKNILLPNSVRLLGYTVSKKYLIENRLHFKKIYAVLIFTSFWCFLEWLRSWIFTGLPWNFVATTQWSHPLLIQIASFTGIYGVSFVVVFMNLSIAELLHSLINSHKYQTTFYKPAVLYAAIFILLLNGLFGYYSIKSYASSSASETNLKTLLIQGDIPQIRSYSAEQAMESLEIYSRYSEEMLPAKPDILIWPESAVPQPLLGNSYLSYEYRSRISNLIEKYQVPILLGTIYYDSRKESLLSEDFKAYNSAILINKSDQIDGIYSKMHLVPWGEYTPGENLFPLSYFYPWIKQKFSMGRSLSPGTENTIFRLKDGIRASVLICFEDAFSYVARRHVINGANLLITITNDAWFPDSNEPSQHLAEAVFRSVENRRTMIRSGNNSGTCVISPLGIITDSIFSEDIQGRRILLPDKQGRGGVIFNVKIEKNPTLSFYTKYGDMFILLLSFVVFSGLLWSFLQWKEREMKLYNLITKSD
ncbi:MAG: apolipoprotein N-acyltransferase [Lentisphaerota bacterium]